MGPLGLCKGFFLKWLLILLFIFFRKCGLLTIDEPPYADVAQVITNVRGVGKECIPLSAEESNKRFPGLNFSPDDSCALEQDSGLIDANSALKAMQVGIGLPLYT